MEIVDVYSMNGIENNPASGEIFLENVILKVSQRSHKGCKALQPLVILLPGHYSIR